jgi:hypothetical protein
MTVESNVNNIGIPRTSRSTIDGRILESDSPRVPDFYPVCRISDHVSFGFPDSVWGPTDSVRIFSIRSIRIGGVRI